MKHLRSSIVSLILICNLSQCENHVKNLILTVLSFFYVESSNMLRGSEFVNKIDVDGNFNHRKFHVSRLSQYEEFLPLTDITANSITSLFPSTSFPRSSDVIPIPGTSSLKADSTIQAAPRKNKLMT